MGNPIFCSLMDTSSYLFLVGRADVEAGHHDGCPWHQVEFGVGGAIVSRPKSRQTKTKEQIAVSEETFRTFLWSFPFVTVS